MKFRLLYLIFLSTILSICGQVKDSTSFYLEDGNISTSKHIVKASVLELIHGLVDLRYEYILNDKFSVELGGGIKLPYRVPYLIRGGFSYEDDYNSFINKASAHHYSIMPKYYCVHKAPENIYIGLQYRHQSFHENDLEIKANTISFHTGVQYATQSRFMLDCSLMAVGFINYEYLNTLNKESEDIGMILTLEFKVGYRL